MSPQSKGQVERLLSLRFTLEGLFQKIQMLHVGSVAGAPS